MVLDLSKERSHARSLADRHILLKTPDEVTLYVPNLAGQVALKHLRSFGWYACTMRYKDGRPPETRFFEVFA